MNSSLDQQGSLEPATVETASRADARNGHAALCVPPECAPTRYKKIEYCEAATNRTSGRELAEFDASVRHYEPMCKEHSRWSTRIT